jgi:hypothetical protein
MQRYASSETHFALLLSVRPKRTMLLENEINSLQERLDALTIADPTSASASTDEMLIGELRNRVIELRSQLEYEYSQQEQRQRQENIRRRHNYIPFIMTLLLRHLSTRNLLQPMIDKAKAKMESSSGVKRKL